MPEIIITAKPNGEVVVDVQGWEGPSCTLKSQPYIKALGKVVKSEPKTEMFVQETEKQKEYN